jgi:hypothetical protein
MNPNASPRRQYLLEEIFGLAVACPFDQGNPCKCPLHELRKKSLRERYEWLHELSEESMKDILTFHEKCLDGKEKISVKIKTTVDAAQAAPGVIRPMTAGN